MPRGSLEKKQNPSLQAEHEPQTPVERAFATPGFAEFFGKFTDAEDFRTEGDFTEIQSREIELRFETFQAIQKHVPELKKIVLEQMRAMFPGVPVDGKSLDQIEQYYTRLATEGNREAIFEMARNMEDLAKKPAEIRAKDAELRALIENTGGRETLQQQEQEQRSSIARNTEELDKISAIREYRKKESQNTELAGETRSALAEARQKKKAEQIIYMIRSCKDFSKKLGANFTEIEAIAQRLGEQDPAYTQTKTELAEIEAQMQPYEGKDIHELAPDSEQTAKLLITLGEKYKALSEKQAGLIRTLREKCATPAEGLNVAELEQRLGGMNTDISTELHPGVVRVGAEVQKIYDAESRLVRLENPMDKMALEDIVREIQNLELMDIPGINLSERAGNKVRQMYENAEQTPVIDREHIPGKVSLFFSEKFAKIGNHFARSKIKDIRANIQNIDNAEQAKAMVQAELNGAGVAVFQETQLVRLVIEDAKRKAEKKRAEELKQGIAKGINAFSNIEQYAKEIAEKPYLGMEDFTVEVQTDDGTESLTVAEMLGRKEEILLIQYEKEVVNKVKAMAQKNVTSKDIITKLDGIRASIGPEGTKPQFAQLEIKALNRAIMNAGINMDKVMVLRTARDMIARKYQVNENTSAESAPYAYGLT